MCPVLGLQIILENIIEIIPENMREKNEREISRRREILMDDMYSGVLEPGPDSC